MNLILATAAHGVAVSKHIYFKRKSLHVYINSNSLPQK